MKKTNTIRAAVVLFLGMTICLVLYRPVPAHSASAREIDIRVDAALKKFYQKVSGGKEFLKHASGVLVFPKVIKAGIGIGGEYGEGALRINGKTVDYYNTASASIGFQLGAQAKKIIRVFLQDQA
jgi:lipid-binding SYLF domain-containing protein